MLGVTTAAQPHINRPTPVSVLNNFTWPNPAERFTFEADADDTSLCSKALARCERAKRLFDLERWTGLVVSLLLHGKMRHRESGCFVVERWRQSRKNKLGEQHAQLNTALELTLRCKKVQSRRQILFATENLLMLCLTASLSLSYGVTPRLATQRVGAVRMDLE